MNTIVFECETITPMFCYGADQTKPEIRAASIKGAMRFWWRALHPDLDIETLRKKETEIFGGAGDSEATRSSFTVRVSNLVNISEVTEKLVPHKENIRARSIKSGSFKVSFDCISERQDTIESLFYLTSILGGIGKRSRRGMGGFRVKKESSNNDNNYPNIDLNYILNHVNVVAQGLYKVSSSEDKIKIDSDPNKKYPYILTIQIGRAIAKASDLLKDISELSHKHNCWYTGSPTRNDPRFASPLYISAIKNGSSFYPIITALKPKFPPGITPGPNEDKSGLYAGELI
ncbi:MAG TPA: type III-B CRISPR module RAMP protein Cmr1 [bacterium]|nr:type III-B CRISPR module RAMP protein Cmr1 [bacterium]